MDVLQIGFGNFLFPDRLIAAVSPDSAPVKRMISDARERGMLIDATQGRKTASVLVADSGHVILSYLTTERLFGKNMTAKELSDD